MLQTLLQSLAQRPMKAAAAIDRAITKALLITNPMLPLVVGRAAQPQQQCVIEQSIMAYGLWLFKQAKHISYCLSAISIST
eukprot:jgi/Chrzof1/10351/Cz04g38250.t1